MQGPVRVVLLLDSSQTHQSCFSPLEGLGECLPDRGYSPGALDICECPWWPAPLWEPRSSKTQSSRKPGWEAKILQLGRGFKPLLPLDYKTHMFWLWEKDSTVMLQIYTISVTARTVSSKTAPYPLGMPTPIGHTWVFISCHAVSVNFQNLPSCY